MIHPMPWVIGIDEAGYGPNLGPLVQAAAMLRLPADDLGGWKTLQPIIRRAHEPDDGRLLVDDSKKVLAAAAGRAALEQTLAGWITGSLQELVRTIGVADSANDLEAEYWHQPHFKGTETCRPNRLEQAGLRQSRIHLVTSARLNRLVDAAGSKAPLLLQGYGSLVRSLLESWQSQEPVIVIADKLGGRHYYASLLQQTFPTGWVVTISETPAESRYRVENLPFPITAVFRPQADASALPVALASMMAKYVREQCMREFNAYWARQVPGLKPTAGYPVDAKRFYREIEPAMKKLGLLPDQVWRKK